MKIVDAEVLEQYVEKIYAFAVKKTFSEDEAADLSQEILLTAIRALPDLREESRFEPWLWGLAANVSKTYRRSQGRRRALFSYNVPEGLEAEETQDEESEELYSLLRQKIAMLSAMYRDIIILHYYDNLSTKEIAARLKIPEGTVTWRLSEARKKIKKEFDKMEESALRPTKLQLDFYGTFEGDDNVLLKLISDALSQNILYHCYEAPHSVEELARLCGVPAYYVEERIQNLLNCEAIREISKGKYRTDFIIWSDKYGIYCEENAERTLLPIMDRLVDALKAIAKQAEQIPFYKAGKSPSDLFYLYGAMAFEYIQAHYCDLPYPSIPKKPDGNRWVYLGSIETGAHRRLCITTRRCTNVRSRGHYSHTVYSGFGGVADRDMMWDTYINVCEDLLTTGSTEDTGNAALAVQAGYIRRLEDNSFFVTVPAFTAEQKTKFDQIVEEQLTPLMDEYLSLTKQFIDGYAKMFPQHLEDSAERMCHHMFLSLYCVVISYAQKNRAIELPSPSYCDVLLERKPQ